MPGPRIERQGTEAEEEPSQVAFSGITTRPGQHLHHHGLGDTRAAQSPEPFGRDRRNTLCQADASCWDIGATW